MNQFFLSLDSFLISFYRLTGYALIDFLAGTFLLAFISVVIGEFSISLAFLWTRRHIEHIQNEMVRYQNLSIEALASGDKESYSAANKLANDAFGKTFFMQIGLSSARVWPAFFAVAWMNTRFFEVDFEIPFTDWAIGYIPIFIVLYVGAYFVFKPIRNRIPYFKKVNKVLDYYKDKTREMKSFADIVKDRKKP
ncbi:MAG: hypothetical protein NTY51_14540 [Deltaproteobacteria bacterium]|nr:hypothetical protein [Deltaproteobacteria bacterium]